MITYKELIANTKLQLSLIDVSDNVAQLLLLNILDIEPHQFYLIIDEQVPPSILSKFETNLDSVLEGKPVQHVIGYQYFYGNKISVNPSVLIPRPESEELVETTIELYKKHFITKEDPYICDMCTGSGAIAIALKKEMPNVNIIASDISEQAINVAYHNAKANETVISFLIGNLLETLIERNLKIDIFVANPPYISTKELLDKSVYNHEPHIALFGGESGLDLYINIFKNINKVINDKAIIIMEIGYLQGKQILNLAKETFPTSNVYIKKDLENKDRMIIIEHNLDI